MSCIEKIITSEIFEQYREQGIFASKKVIFTNGCFDILHSGHVLYLEEARSLGDFLVIGLNSDLSVKRLKGKGRPINTEQERAIVLSGLSFVDYIIFFEEDTPFELIKSIRPDVLVKGGDWAIEKIVGHDIVTQSGGEVRSLLFKEGKSSTAIIERINNL